MVYTGTKQPALLYIIPILFITTFITAGLRREWGSKLSIDSSLESDGFKTGGKNSSSKEKTETEASARGISRFDVQQFASNRNSDEFRKFENDDAEEPAEMQ
jgi:hypothetical protein